MLTIEHDDDGGCFRLIDDGIGLCTSKSRNVLVRLRDALNAVGESNLGGITVKHQKDTIPNRVDGYPRGVVLALVSGPPQLVVRRTDNNALDVWHVTDCVVVEPARPDKDTPSNEPPIGVRTACELLTRWLHEVTGGHALDQWIAAQGRVENVDPNQALFDLVTRTTKIVNDTQKFLAARAAAEPVP